MAASRSPLRVRWRPPPFERRLCRRNPLWRMLEGGHRTAQPGREAGGPPPIWLGVDIVDAPVGRHLPALDGVVEEARVQATNPDQLGARRLDVAGRVGAPRLENDLAPVPAPVEPEASVGEREDGVLEARLLTGFPCVRRDLDPADQPAARP